MIVMKLGEFFYQNYLSWRYYITLNLFS
jgi:hypothetical protein